MDKDFLQIELLEKYIQDELSTEEKAEVESQLRSDVAFRELYEDILLTTDGIRMLAEQKVVQQLNESENQLREEGFFLNDEQLDDFLAGNADELTMQLIKSRMKVDEAFRKEMELREQIRLGIRSTTEHNTLNTILQAESALREEGFFEPSEEKNSTSEKKQANTVFIRSRWFALAASIAVVVAGIWLVWFYTLKPVDIQADFFEKFPDELSESLTSSGFADREEYPLLLEALEFYQFDSLDKAVEKFQQFQQQYSDSDLVPHAKFYEAISLMVQGKTEEAQRLLIELSTTEFRLQSAARWYLALVYIEKNNSKTARPLLEELATEEGFRYQEQAQRLLRRI